MNNPCDSCAFVPGTVTHDSEPHNLLRATICLLGPLPFQCHYLRDGRDIHADPAVPRYMSGNQYRGVGFRVCEGWRREVRELAATGYFKDSPRRTKAYGMLALEELEIMLASEAGSEDWQEANQRLQLCMTRLGDKRRRYQ